MNVQGFRLKLLSPLTYHGLLVQDGSATVHEILSDSSLAFALASTLGWMPQGPSLPISSSYRRDWKAMPFRVSMPCAIESNLMSPLTRRLNIDIEGGLPRKLAGATGSGNVKTFFKVQSIAPGSMFEGIYVGPQLDTPRSFVLRMGLGRQSEVLLEWREPPEKVRLNAYTAQWFDKSLPCESYLLNSMQVSPWMNTEDAAHELASWGLSS